MYIIYHSVLSTAYIVILHHFVETGEFYEMFKQLMFMTHEFLPVPGNISSKFASNSEAFASELLENLAKIFPHCHCAS